MQHSLNEVIQLLTSNTVPVCVCVCWLSISFKISTNTRTIRVTTAIQLNTATNSTAKKSPIHAAYKQSPTLTLHTPNTKLKPIKNHVSRAVTELGGFSSLWLFLFGEFTLKISSLGFIFEF